MASKEHIVRGPELKKPWFNGSLSQMMYKGWMEHLDVEDLLVDVVNDVVISSRQLLTYSIQAAVWLKKLGMKKSDRVLTYGKNSVHQIVAGYSVALSCAVLAPVDPNLKTNELQHMCKLIEPKFVFCEKLGYATVKSAVSALPNKVTIIVMDDASTEETEYVKFAGYLQEQADIEKFEPVACIDPSIELALIASSSGTTGLPKGVGVTHENLMFQMVAWNDRPIVPKLIQITQFFWFSALLPWMMSGTVGLSRVLIREFDEAALLRAVEKHKPEWTIITPADVITWTRHPDFPKYDLTSMKMIACGGTALNQTARDVIRNNWHESLVLSQGYGATEMSGTITRLGDVEKIDSVGQLATGISMKVIDQETKQSLGPNQTGELCFKSPGLMLGYVNNEEATRQAIDDNGWYHTGDLGYYDEEFYIYINGRCKEIFKYRAVHIAPREFEQLIEQLPGVLEVAVTSIPHPEDVNHPIALVVKIAESKITEKEIVDHIVANLADTKRLRAGVIFVDSLPKTTTGKIKRVALKPLALELYNARNS